MEKNSDPGETSRIRNTSIILESWIRIRVTIQEIKWLKMEPWRVVDAHNGGMEAQKFYPYL
jgi:hypothetical protein